MISIVIRSKNDAELIGATISAVHRQDLDDEIELIHIDSGSTDGTVDLIREARPRKLIEIKAEEYVPGLVLNRGMREASGEWVVFLNSDCQPANPQWLRELLSKSSDAGVGAIFGRQEPRPGCRAVYAADYERCYGDARESSRWEHFFSMANSAVNRAAWEEQPFREDLQYSEDDEWSRRLRQRGWSVAYAENARVLHSHNYTLRQAFNRCYGEAFAQATIKTLSPGRVGFFRTMILGNAREAVRDLGYCWRSRRIAEWPYALAVRTWQRAGKLRGFREGWRRCHAGASEAVAR